MSRRVEIIGGGPAGLYAARLLRLADPTCQVVVHERLAGNAETFGFGVGLTESTMANLERADAETAAEIRAVGYAGHTLDLRGDGASVTLHGARNLAIGRAALLDILSHAARRVGVEYRAGSDVDVTSVEADVVIAADGVRSRAREKLAAELGVHEAVGRSRFVWCGTDFAVDAAFFRGRQTAEGTYVVHAYPFADDRSTFLIEVDEDTWRNSPLESYDVKTPPGATDQRSVARLEQVFEEELRGRRLLTNRTRWSRFATLTLERWSTGNIVLIGDAAHTAHYTLGSGTKLALEDSIALVDALSGAPSVEAAFMEYESRRRPPVERFKHLAGRSQRWWDSYRLRADRPIEEVALSYMTRAGNLGVTDYAREQPDTVVAAVAHLDGEPPADSARLEDWVLSRPVHRGGLRLPTAEVSESQLDQRVESVQWTEPDVWGEAADAEVARLRDGTEAVRLTGPAGAQFLGARIDFAERLVLQTDRLVVVDLPAEARSQGAAAVAARRCHAVVAA